MTSLYVHIPFCARKCFYCSFAVVVAQEHHAARYVDCLLREAAAYHGTAVGHLYLGGGTPSLLPESELRRLFAGLAASFRLADDAEISIEANPETVDESQAAAFAGVGITRVSIGAQSFSDQHLRHLGRSHDQRAVAPAVRALRAVGISNINLDLMFSLPGQTTDEVLADLARVDELGCEHVSVYALTVEAQSRFFIRRVRPQDEPQEAESYAMICERLSAMGLRQYEVSNFARPGYESRHNQHYWLGGDYIGLGMAAHSHQDGRRSWNVSRFRDYLSRVESGQSPCAGDEILTPGQRLREGLVFGLRMNQGVDVAALQERYQTQLPQETRQQLRRFAASGWLRQEQGRWVATPAGRLLLDGLAVYLI